MFNANAAGIDQATYDKWAPHLIAAMDRFEINTPLRVAHFLAQVGHESQGFAKLVENMTYTDPERIARIFRSPFDLDGDRVIDPEEIEFAKAYVRDPRKLGNRAYANRNGNGNEASGDGYNYRARSPIGLTGRANYAKAGEALSIDLVAKPELAELPKHGAQIAAWWWVRNGCNILADADQFDAITKRVNGGTNGIDDRRARLRVAKAELL